MVIAHLPLSTLLRLFCLTADQLTPLGYLRPSLSKKACFLARTALNHKEDSHKAHAYRLSLTLSLEIRYETVTFNNAEGTRAAKFAHFLRNGIL